MEPATAADKSAMRGRSHPLRASLAITVVLMGLFCIAMVYVSGAVYKRLTVASAETQLSETIGVQVRDLIAEMHNQSMTMGMQLQLDEEFRYALAYGDEVVLDYMMNQPYHQYFVTAGLLHLERMLLYSTSFELLASSTEATASVNSADCPLVTARAMARKGPERLKVLADFCRHDGRTHYMVVVPVGGLKPSAFLAIIVDPTHNIKKLETALGHVIRVEAPDGKELYASDIWKQRKASHEFFNARHDVKNALGESMLHVNALRNSTALKRELALTQQWVMLSVAVASLLTVAIVIFILHRIVLNPLQNLCLRLRDVGHLNAAGRDQQDEQGTLPQAKEFHELQELYNTLESMALRDPLTDLPNRRAFEKHLDVLLDTHDGKVLHALCFLDLDQFKVVNDSCGHAAGDELLRQIAQVMQREVRGGDMLARLGGDEFGILLADCTLSNARKVANGLREAVEDFRFHHQGQSFSVGVSIGLVPIDVKGLSRSGLMSLADAACYAAKDEGRNRIVVCQPDQRDDMSSPGDSRWASRLTTGLDEGRFALYAQEIRAIAGNTAEPQQHFEILLRLLDEGGGLVLPGAFIPAAERFKLMPSIDRWVLQKTFHWIAGNQAQLPDGIVFAINLSGQSISDERLLSYIISELDSSGIAPEAICFEITETAALANMSSAVRFVSILKGMGCQFSLDDFGIGLSSFSYLKQLQVDFVKIDGGFVRDITEDPVDLAMVESINRVGHVMNLKTVAENVQDIATFKLLKKIGVNYAQGTFLDSPSALAELPAKLKKSRQARLHVIQPPGA